jgi:polyisoprenoid-binding protein YceI
MGFVTRSRRPRTRGSKITGVPVRWCLAALALPAAAVPSHGAAQEYHVDLDADNVVRFISEATIEDFEGVTDRIDGFIVLGEGGLTPGATEGSDFYLEVDLGSIDTGIGLRNRHMRDNYLETERFPYATFGGTFAEVSEGDDGWTRVTGRGDMVIHGVSRSMEIPCEVAPSGTGFRARCAFQVLLSDFDIEIPKVMFMKLANEIRLELDFFVAPAGVEGAGS